MGDEFIKPSPAEGRDRATLPREVADILELRRQAIAEGELQRCSPLVRALIEDEIPRLVEIGAGLHPGEGPSARSTTWRPRRDVAATVFRLDRKALDSGRTAIYGVLREKTRGKARVPSLVEEIFSAAEDPSVTAFEIYLAPASSVPGSRRLRWNLRSIRA